MLSASTKASRAGDPHLNTDSLACYFREVGRTDLLSAEEERELARRIRTGDSAARDQMVRANLRLVVAIARLFCGRGLGLTDLIQEGNLGLLRAVETFDPDIQPRFANYAKYWIKEAIRVGISRNARTVRVPGSLRKLRARCEIVSRRLEPQLGRMPTHAELAAELGVTVRRVARAYEAEQTRTLSLDSSAHGPQSDPRRVPEPPATSQESSPELVVETQDFVAQLKRIISERESRDTAILSQRFGLEGETPRSLREIGEEWGLTKERVRQIIAKSISDLRDELLPAERACA